MDKKQYIQPQQIVDIFHLSDLMINTISSDEIDNGGNGSEIPGGIDPEAARRYQETYPYDWWPNGLW